MCRILSGCSLDRTISTDTVSYTTLLHANASMTHGISQDVDTPGLNFNGLSLRLRHLLVVTATLLLGPRPQSEAFYGYATSLEEELGVIIRRLSASDRHSLAQRLMKWSADP